MNKRGIALIFALMVVLVLSILAGSFFIKSINENNLVKRYVNSVRAFWTAEAGVAEAIDNLPNSPTNGTLGNYRYETTTSYRAAINFCDYYDIASTGIVTLPGLGDIQRTIEAAVKTGPSDETKFQYGIDAANDLCFGGIGSCNRPPEGFLNPNNCNGHDCWKEFDTTINFTDLFGYSQSDIENIATHYTDAAFNAIGGAVSGVTWVDVTENLDGTPGTLEQAGNLEGDGLLIIDGNARFDGQYNFDGIVYVLGSMTMIGNNTFTGSVIVASSSGLDQINGTPIIRWNQAKIKNALKELANNFVDIVSWKEAL